MLLRLCGGTIGRFQTGATVITAGKFPSQAARERGLWRAQFERDSCGFGLLAQLDDEPRRDIVTRAIEALSRLTHRGAVAADGKTGDGCGLLIRRPTPFLAQAAADAGIQTEALFASGMVFLSHEPAAARTACSELARQVEAAGLQMAGWREPPLDRTVCGEQALAILPGVRQLYVNAPAGMGRAKFNRQLFLARRRAEMALREDAEFYVLSLSSDAIVYKGMVLPRLLAQFYQDLNNPLLSSSVCVFHQRFSTNTLPQWRLAQPFRYLAHNGEINTIRGNRNWAMARRTAFDTPLLPELAELDPLVSMDGSDSSSLDNMLEVLLSGGMDVLQAMRLLIPPAWQAVDGLDPDVRAFYEYYSSHMEPWDGPAGIVLCDERYAACSLDRNGLRPARYSITNDRTITIASETGVIDYPASQVVAKGRLGPGQMLAVDLQTGRLLDSQEIDRQLSARQPYKQWLRDGVRYLDSQLVDVRLAAEPMDPDTLSVYQKMFGITGEERSQVIRVLAEAEMEAVGSMGDDTPIAVLSQHVRSPYDYFRQQFAQVTNPPIDPLRESIVMSLQTQIGRECNVFEPRAQHAHQIVLNSPVLSQRKLRQIMSFEEFGVTHRMLNLSYNAEQETLDQAITRLCDDAARKVRNGNLLLVLSDRKLRPGQLPVHALLAIGAVNQRLVRDGLRCQCNLVVETGTARDSHQFACLIGYGATAVYPYMAYQCLYDMRRTGEIKAGFSRRQLGRSYRRGIRKGLLKIMSKMGIATIGSYRSAQLFEIVGLHDAVVAQCFEGTVSRLQGAGFADLQQDQQRLASRAWNAKAPISQGGLLKYVHRGEYHMFNAEVVQSLQQAVRSGERAAYQVFADHVNQRPVSALRDLIHLREDVQPVPLDEVESLEAITRRFECAGMSLGALSPEAHEALAIAMNRIGGRSNSGEGGEDSSRYGTERRSKIKQVASGRFGVTPSYLVSAEALQIKIAQGAKPGEGGQLPGHKVDEVIARLRFARPGVGLISPPPHHDIYSIEDLAQLIFDLKQVNPQALVSVKLVSEPGVGTIAAGVAKAYADLITISGHDGGTGASALTSVKHAGSPWELGLAETHQTLRANGLRHKVLLQTDGGLKTGLDVIKAAVLGAESFGFGTAPLISLGCKYLRICHLNNCAVGVATQQKVLRTRFFTGLPEMVISYFNFVAQETREIMAALGVRTMDELVGRTDLVSLAEGNTPRQRGLDLAPLLSDAGLDSSVGHLCTEPSNDPFDKGELAEQMLSDMLPAIEQCTGGQFEYAVSNYHRSIGARLSGEIARRHGDYGMDHKPVRVHLRGSAGQSFGAWNAGGLHMSLEGDANDYVGKGMAAGKLVIYPPADAGFVPRDTAIIGNTCLYGATGGELYAAGVAGERFAVRNSGASAVIEGAGDHCCEYMTDGVVLVLGRTGLNFGAGMTGGFAVVLDQERDFVDRYNHDLIDIHRITPERMESHLQHLYALLERHRAETSSRWAGEILEDFRTFVGKFWLVKPKAADLHSLIESLRRAS